MASSIVSVITSIVTGRSSPRSLRKAREHFCQMGGANNLVLDPCPRLIFIARFFFVYSIVVEFFNCAETARGAGTHWPIAPSKILTALYLPPENFLRVASKIQIVFETLRRPVASDFDDSEFDYLIERVPAAFNFFGFLDVRQEALKLFKADSVFDLTLPVVIDRVP